MERAVIRDDRIEQDSEKVAEILKKPKEEVKMVLETVLNTHKNNKRQPKPPVPDGYINCSEAERRFGVSNEQFSNWARKGYIPSLPKVGRDRYILASKAEEMATEYKKNPGQGKWTIRKSQTASDSAP